MKGIYTFFKTEEKIIISFLQPSLDRIMRTYFVTKANSLIWVEPGSIT